MIIDRFPMLNWLATLPEVVEQYVYMMTGLDIVKMLVERAAFHQISSPLFSDRRQ
jgi:hypothetical protein